MELKKALCLDFDGTIRRSKSGATFINGADDIELIPNIEKWIWRYRDMGWLIFGVTNQAGVAHGFKSVFQNEQEIDRTLGLFKNGNPFHAVQSCLHDGKGKIEPYNHRSLYRKPNIGMLCAHEDTAWKRGYIIDWDNSLFVGDRPEDEQCAKNAGIPFRHIDHFLTQPHTFEISSDPIIFPDGPQPK